jgi:hypothetical protein
MPQLKTRDGTPRPEPTCYKLGGSQLGTSFDFPDRTRLFAHYSFLSHVEMRGENEIAVHYTFGLVRMRGRHLEAIYSLMKQHSLDLARLSEADDPCRNEIEVTQILFETSKEGEEFEG